MPLVFTDRNNHVVCFPFYNLHLLTFFMASYFQTMRSVFFNKIISHAVYKHFLFSIQRLCSAQAAVHRLLESLMWLQQEDG
jgi:hypothetical protein